MCIFYGISCLFVSLLNHFWLIHFFHQHLLLPTICRTLVGYLCSITLETAKVCSSYNHMRGPGIGRWFSDRSNCSHRSFEAAVLQIKPDIYTDHLDNLSSCITLLLYWRYTIMRPTLLTSWLQLLVYKVQTITAEVCTVATAIPSASVGAVPVGYSTCHVDLAR